MSGGQRHRVALARACYTQSDIALLDDPLSAVDTHVGSHLFSNCICGFLRDRTRVLATHQMQYLPEADWVVVMEAGKISHQGRYAMEVATIQQDAHYCMYCLGIVKAALQQMQLPFCSCLVRERTICLSLVRTASAMWCRAEPSMLSSHDSLT